MAAVERGEPYQGPMVGINRPENRKPAGGYVHKPARGNGSRSIAADGPAPSVDELSENTIRRLAAIIENGDDREAVMAARVILRRAEPPSAKQLAEELTEEELEARLEELVRKRKGTP